MRTQYTLSPQRQADVFNIAFYADTLQIINFTPYVLYLRIGDNITAGPTSYHNLIPPATAATIPCVANHFSAALAVGGSTGFTTVLAQRVDFIFSAGEPVANLSQLTLSIQNGQVFTTAALIAGANEAFTIDARGYEAISLSILITGGLGVSVEVSPDAGVSGWFPLKNFRADFTGWPKTFDTFLPNPYGWFRVTLYNDTLLGWGAGAIFIYNLVHEVPDVLSFRNEVHFTRDVIAGPVAPGAILNLITYPRFSGHVKKMWMIATGPFDVNPLSANYMLPLTALALIQADLAGTIYEPFLKLPTSWTLNAAGTVQRLTWEVELDIYAALSLTIDVVFGGPGASAVNLGFVTGTVEIGEER